MNRIISEQFGLFRLYQRLREQLLATISEDDLSFSPGGSNPTLGELCLEIGETERAYIDSFHTFTQRFDYRHSDRGLSGSVAGLKVWFEELDAELYAAIEALGDSATIEDLVAFMGISKQAVSQQLTIAERDGQVGRKAGIQEGSKKGRPKDVWFNQGSETEPGTGDLI